MVFGVNLLPRAVALLAVVLGACSAGLLHFPVNYAHWRNRTAVSLQEWRANVPPADAPVPDDATFDRLTSDERQAQFVECINAQARTCTEHAMAYRSPRLAEVRAAVDSTLLARNMTVAVAVFWGRHRYVSILWRYLERNLRANGGIVDKLLLITHKRDSDAGFARAAEILRHATEKYPTSVFAVPFCDKPYGCAYDEILTDPRAVYVKVDDDVVFVKDGSFEHLALQVLTNPEYTLYSGSVANNPHGIALHRFVGAYPATSYHWRTLGSSSPPFYNASDAASIYYGKNVYDTPGSQAHEAFVYNVAAGRLDVYAFDLWNMHHCRCGKPQPALDMCTNGFYRWSINAFAWTKGSVTQKRPVPKFDEPEIGIGWVMTSSQKRVAVVGESLFVHCQVRAGLECLRPARFCRQQVVVERFRFHVQYTRQRTSKPDFGLREVILLPWYDELAKQYCATEFGGWAGNASLLHLYESMAYSWGEDRYSRSPKDRRPHCPDKAFCNYIE